MKRTKLFEEEVRDLEEWIMEKEREISMEDGAIFYQEQLRERFDHFQVCSPPPPPFLFIRRSSLFNHIEITDRNECERTFSEKSC